MVVVVRNWMEGGGLSTSDRIAAELGVPVRTIRSVAGELEDVGMLLFAQGDQSDKGDSMAPARDPRELRFFDVIGAATGSGTPMPHLGETELMRRIETTYEKVRADVGASADNPLLTDLI
jgi:DNA-binding IscR family transcriptional regulator